MPLLTSPRPHLLRQLESITPRFYSTSPSTLKISSIPAPHAGSIKIISLNRPQARNAISKQLLAELGHEIHAIAQEAEDGPTRALILASECEGAFCAGADLKERVGFTEAEYVPFLLPFPTFSPSSLF